MRCKRLRPPDTETKRGETVVCHVLAWAQAKLGIQNVFKWGKKKNTARDNDQIKY